MGDVFWVDLEQATTRPRTANYRGARRQIWKILARSNNCSPNQGNLAQSVQSDNKLSSNSNRLNFVLPHIRTAPMGIPRIIRKGMKEHNGTQPDILVQDERFTIRLYA